MEEELDRLRKKKIIKANHLVFIKFYHKNIFDKSQVSYHLLVYLTSC